MKIIELKEKYPLVYEAAIKNLDEDYTDQSSSCHAFVWEDTPEGCGFWKKVYERNFDSAKEICPHLFEDKPKIEPKYNVGDTLKVVEGGFQFYQTGLECDDAISYFSSKDSLNKTGKCTKRTYSIKHNVWFYKIGDYANMFTEDGVILDKPKDIWEGVEYAECLEDIDRGNQFTKGKVYKIKSINEKWLNVKKDDRGSTTNGWHIKYFKPSTKEAYDAQNKLPPNEKKDEDICWEQKYDEALSKFKVGDKVRVARKIESCSCGWNNHWVETMDSFIGRKSTIKKIKENRCGIILNNNNYEFPPQALEKVEEEKKEESSVTTLSFKVTTNNNIDDFRKAVARYNWQKEDLEKGTTGFNYNTYTIGIDPYTDKPSSNLPEIKLRRNSRSKSKSNNKRLNLKIK